ncbi:MAG: M23 family metallopeptidase [Gemmatimonadaceae bacterium]|nr:M23 family metallopeptidase [Gemmatimonadaceae bacterium]
MLVPHETGATRAWELTPRRITALRWSAVVAGLIVAGAAAVLFLPWATPSGRLAAAENARLRVELDAQAKEFATLRDTLAELERRDEQIRLLAGMPSDSLQAAAGIAPSGEVGVLQPTDEKRAFTVPAGGRLAPRKPFLGRLAFSGSSRPDIGTLLRRATSLSASFGAVRDTLQRNMERMANTPSIMPTAGWLTSHFSKSRFHPILHINRPHEGIDVTAEMGAPIVAPAAGRVISAGNEPGFGLTIEVDHGNGIVTKYAHCSRIVARRGQRVGRGEVIAAVGSTGLSNGPHLHYEIHVRGKAVDPLTYVLPGVVPD